MPADASSDAGARITARAPLGDRRLALAIGLALFVLVGWPLLVVRIPPYQDLPAHLAAATILASPERYPDLVATGFLEPGSVLFLWMSFAGPWLGLVAAAKVFALAVLAGHALVLPRFVLHFTDRARMVLAAPLLVPMVHNWFVSTGMLGFAASFPFALALLVALDELVRAAPDARAATSARVAVLALVTWYVHPFPIVAVVLMLAAAAGAELASKRGGGGASGEAARGRWTLARAALPPLAPTLTLAAIAFVRWVVAAGPTMEAPVFSSLQWALYNLWGQWMYGFTELSAVSLVPALVLAAAAALRWREGRALLGPAPLVVLALVYLLGPYVAFDATYVTPRLIPFLWALALVRLPPRLPRVVQGALGASAAAYLVAMPIDLVRLSRELDEFAAGAPAVPEGARLLTLNFNERATSKNTASLATAWGLYVFERHTSAVDGWASVTATPIVRSSPLPPRLDPVTRLRFVRDTRTREVFCADRRAKRLLTVACEEMWQDEWDAFWREAVTYFDHVLLWDPPAEVMATIPDAFTTSFVRGRLRILARRPE
ncbi:MAG: hypothetical protein KF782_23785 [Labilithrix sp.]|nr:hypothetical protein [Labilithrix sp.]